MWELYRRICCNRPDITIEEAELPDVDEDVVDHCNENVIEALKSLYATEECDEEE